MNRVALIVACVALPNSARGDSTVRVATIEPPPIVARTAASEAAPARPWALDATLASRLTLTAGDDITGRLEVGGSRRFDDRWHAGLRAELEVGPHLVVIAELAEVGIWLHGSRRLEVLLAWRIGHAYFDFGYADVHALVLEPVAELSYRLSDAAELRIAPLVITAYRSGIWQVTVGPEVGLAWRL